MHTFGDSQIINDDDLNNFQHKNELEVNTVKK